MTSTEEPPPVETVPLPRTRTYTRLMKRVSRVPLTGPTKVSIVGAGRVGSATAFAVLSMGLCTDMALVDLQKDIVDGEKMDMLHGQAFLGRRCVIEASSDCSITKDSKIVILTIEHEPEKPFETTTENEVDKAALDAEVELDIINKNVEMFRVFIPQILEHSPDCIIIVVSNPCDIMAWVTWKLSGLPKHRIISTGTMLDTSRFRSLIADVFNIAAHSVHGYIVGAHGESSVAVWSSVNIAGEPLRDLCPMAGESPEHDAEDWVTLFHHVIETTSEIIRLKGYPSCWSIGLMCAKLTETILENQTILTVGTMPDGWNEITDEVFLSMPCVVGLSGISHIVSMPLSGPEVKQIKDSARAMRNIISGIHV